MEYNMDNATSGALRVSLIDSDQQDEEQKQKKCVAFRQGCQNLINACKQMQGFQDDNLVRPLCYEFCHLHLSLLCLTMFYATVEKEFQFLQQQYRSKYYFVFAFIFGVVQIVSKHLP